MCVSVVVGQEWRVSYPQHGACALVGSSVNTSCSYSLPSAVTDQKVSVQWMTIHRYQDHIHVTCRDQTRVCPLHIYPVKSSDARDYYCKVTVNGAVKWIGQPGFKLLATGEVTFWFVILIHNCTTLLKLLNHITVTQHNIHVISYCIA